MALTYDEFKNTVPKETSEFFDKLLPLLNVYLVKDKDLNFTETIIAKHSYSKTFYLSLYALSSLKEYMAFLGECGFKRNAYQIESNITTNMSKEELYEKFNYLIPHYDDKSLYEGLQPLEIISDACYKYTSNCNVSVFEYIFSNLNSTSAFRNKIGQLIREKKQEAEIEIEKEIFNKVPIQVISHIEKASKIRTILKKKLSYDKNGVCKEIDSDMVPLSLLLALYYNDTHNNNNNNQSKDLNPESAFIYLFREQGIDIEKINNVLGINLGNSDIKNIDKNIYAIKNLYKKYYNYTDAGLNKNNPTPNKNNASIENIIKCILDRNFTNSLVIEKLFSKLECNVDMFKNIEQKVERAIENQKKIQEAENIKSFYKDIPTKTKDFIEFAAKTYLLILDKMTQKKHNDDILSTDSDAVVLSLYIASHFFNGVISEFFNDNGVSFSKVMKLLNLNVKKEEIENIEIDRNVLVSNFKKFVYGGENSSKYSHKISISDICYNICKSEFNKSKILENIFNSLTSELSLTNNFISEMRKHFEDKEVKLKLQKTQKLFHDIPVESIEIIENASRIYNKLLKSPRGLDERSAQSISVLLSAVDYDNEEIKEFLQSLGFSPYQISNYFGIDHSCLRNAEIDIDLLIKDYGLLMFGLANKDKKREELTPIAMLRNIFSKEFNNSNVAFSRFLKEYELSYEKLKDIDSLYQNYHDKILRKEKEELLKTEVSEYGYYCRELIYAALMIHNKLGEVINDDNCDFKDEDKIGISFLLSAVINTDLIRSELSTSKILSALGLEIEFLDDIRNYYVDYDLFKGKYKKYLSVNKRKNDIEPIDIFREVIKDNKIIKDIIEKCGCNYKIIETEIETGMSYENTITIDDRIQTLKNIEIESINQDNMQSVMEFGNSLLTHSKYIHAQLPQKIDYSVDESVETLNSIINNLYVENQDEEKQQGIFGRLFGSQELTQPKSLINAAQLSNLKESIDDYIETLKSELLNYDEIRKYISEYIKKNREYYIQADDILQQIQEKIEKIDPNDDEQYSDYLSTSSLIHIVNDKVNRFCTTNLLMKKELLRVNQSIVNHFITINSLEMAKNDLIPLIETEIALSRGKETEHNSLELSKNVIGLFQSLLTRNVESTIESMEKLESSNIPEEVFISINNDINTYLQGVNQIKTLQEKIEVPEIQTSEEKVLSKKNNDRLKLDF